MRLFTTFLAFGLWSFAALAIRIPFGCGSAALRSSPSSAVSKTFVTRRINYPALKLP
jgi:hypothetical protein